MQVETAFKSELRAAPTGGEKQFRVLSAVRWWVTVLLLIYVHINYEQALTRKMHNSHTLTP